MMMSTLYQSQSNTIKVTTLTTTPPKQIGNILVDKHNLSFTYVSIYCSGFYTCFSIESLGIVFANIGI